MSIYRQCCECDSEFSVKFNYDPKKFCGLSCSTINKNKISKEKKILEYLKSPKLCKQCNSIIDYDIRVNKFCGHSCSAEFNNPLRPTRSKESRNKTSKTLKNKPTTKKIIKTIIDPTTKQKINITSRKRFKHSPVLLCCSICQCLFVESYI